jgi:tetratricopeptide (TPR) repeat protein
VTAVELPRIAGLRLLHVLDREHGLVTPVGAKYRFRQRLVQEKLYDDLPPTLRAAYHTALAMVLQSKVPEDGACSLHLASEIARHHLRGEGPGKAIPYARQALDYLVGQYEPRAARAMAEQLLELEAALPTELRAQVAYMHGSALLSHGTPDAAAESLSQARELAQVLGDRHLATRALIRLIDCERSAGRFEPARTLAEEGVKELESVDDVSLATQVHDRHSLILRDLGETDASHASASLGLASATAAEDALNIGKLSATLGSLEIESGKLDEAGLLLDRAVSIASLQGDRELETNALTALAKIAFFEGKLETTFSLLRRVLQIAFELGNTRLEAVTATNLALVMPSAGEFAESEALARRAKEIGTTFAYPEVVAHALLTIGQAQVDQGQFGAGLGTFGEAQAVIAEMATPTMEARLNLLLPVALTWVGRFDEASTMFERGLAAANKSSSPREVFLIKWGMGLLLATQDRRAEALDVMIDANAQLRESGAEAMAVQTDQRIAELYVLEGRDEDARVLLESALEGAEKSGLRGVAVLCRTWIKLLPGGNPLHARQDLEMHAAVVPAIARLRALKVLADRTANPEVLADARAAAEALVASVAPEHREAMVTGVPLYRALLR